MEANLLIIEDDTEFADYLWRGLTYEGYRVRVATSAEAGLEQMHQHHPDLMILDVMLPDLDGMEMCRRLRAAGYHFPVLMLTARDALSDRVFGLDAGADDYLVKPFVFDELLARLRAQLRRATVSSRVVTFSDLELSISLRAARRHGHEIPLSRIEYDLLALFLYHPQQVLARSSIIESVWGGETTPTDNMLDVYVSRLRRKLGIPLLIHTLHGVGYVLKEGTE
jgi:two-component system response regulator MprA